MVGTADLQKERLTGFEIGFDCSEFPALTKYIAAASASASDSSSRSAKSGSGGIGALDQSKIGGKGRILRQLGAEDVTDSSEETRDVWDVWVVGMGMDMGRSLSVHTCHR